MKTTKRMGLYKHYLLSLTVWNFILMITALWLLQYEVVDCTTMVLVIRGPLQYLDEFYSHLCTFIVIVSTNNVAMALFLCSVFKYIHLSLSGGLRSVFSARQLHLISFTCHFLVTVFTTAPALFSYIPTSVLRNMTNYKYNPILKMLSKETLLIYDPVANHVVLVFARMRLIFGSVIYTLIVIFLILTIRSLRKRKAILRKKTFRLQKMLIRTLVIHTMIPIFGLLLPLIVMPLVINAYVPVLQVINVIFVSVSTILNNLSTIYFIKPYRRAVVRVFSCTHPTSPLQISKSSVISTAEFNGSLL
ncbi:hypothetical protein FO519_003976 [Halicephalobus sp. NKZ332]|nr:hypothetical protein FO519_003976 [Halicephalobus sp. NKZ332]